jgi:tetratricopeptide (TPR) repeat protein
LSKLSQLKQKAYKAGKDRNWDLAISVYEQILEVEKSNPTVINELGDLCLKAGDARQAVKHFLSAATKYRKTGLLNNSVAICKKILRHDDKNIHAHWYLAEIRATQDLLVEGEGHAAAFLEGGDKSGSEIQEIFLKRCVKVMELYPASLDLMERLMQIYRARQMTLEAGRAGCLKACVMYDTGDNDSAQKMIDDLLETSPELRNYPEYGKWNKRVNPEEASSGPLSDYNSVNLAAGEPVENPTSEAHAEVAPKTETSFSDIKIDIPEELVAEAASEAALVDDVDEEGCLVIDTDDDSDMAALIAQATSEIQADETPAEEDVEAVIPVETPSPAATVSDEPAESVDLLAQILSEDSSSVLGTDSDQLDTIAAEIGSVVGGDSAGADADRLYEMGMVYLEMGLFDKACESFETAAADDDFTIRAHEMWGITLQRAGRPDEAITVLTSGLQFAEADSRENLGLRYHIGRAHELADRPDPASEIYEGILGVAPNFLDVTTRLSQLAGAR